MDNSTIIILALVGGIIALCLFFLPTGIAFNRDHHYRWIIFIINLIFGVTGIGYVIAFTWAVWPRRTGIADVVRNDLVDNSLAANKEYYRQRGCGETQRAYDVARYGAPQSMPVVQYQPVQQIPVNQPITIPPQTGADGQQQAKVCPLCGEIINARAIKCKHCRSMLVA